MKLISEDFREEITKRIDKIHNEMDLSGCEALLIGSNANIYYCSGKIFRGYVYITQKYKPLWFIIKPQTFEIEDDVFYIRRPEDILTKILDNSQKLPDTIGLELNDLSYSDIIRLKSIFASSNMINGSMIMKNARKIKTSWEIKEMKEDGRRQAKIYGEVKDCYRKGMTDLELQIEIERKLRLEGSIGFSRLAGTMMEINLGSVISGDNADVPSPYEFTMGGSGIHPSLPVGANGSRITEGQTIMIDMSGAFNGYQTDMTRVWCLGQVSSLSLKAHECSVKILKKLEKKLPGTPIKDLYETALNEVRYDNLEEFFMGHRSQVGFIGHGIGIELNELPVINSRSTDHLAVGMTVAIEPKFVIPHIGAVGIENTYYVTPEGLENITVFPEEIQHF